MKEGTRLVEIDIARGITILLVVLFHSAVIHQSEVLLDGRLAGILKSFRMPLFFILTGYLFSTSKYLNNLPKLFTDKVKSLLIPYTSFGLISAGIWYLLIIQNSEEIVWFEPLMGLLYGNGDWIAGNEALWFLVCLLCASIVFGFVLKFTINQNFFIRVLSFVFLGIVGYGIGRIIWLPFSLDIALMAAMFMYFGHILKEKQVLIKHKLMRIVLTVSLVMFPLSIHFNGHIDMNHRTYDNIFWFYVGGMTGSVLVLFVSKFLLAKSKLISKTFSYMGKESIIILGFHMSVGYYFVHILDLLSGINVTGNFLLTTFITIPFTLLLGLIIDKIPILSLLFKGGLIRSKTIKSEKEIIRELRDGA